VDCETIVPAVNRLWKNARLVTFAGRDAGIGIIEHGVVVARGETIVFAGPAAEAPEMPDAEEIDCAGRLVTPGLIDCHTHLVYAGSRAAEFERRLAGATYEDIARAGGGISSTMQATRHADAARLKAESRTRLQRLINEGVTTVEIKSGYGLDLANELKQLRVARALGAECGVTVRTTLLSAHALPPEFNGRPDAYIDFVCDQIIPQVAAEGLADSVDAFCETIGFSREQTERVFKAARAHQLPVRLHAEQLSNMQGAALAAQYGAQSADHLEYLDEAGAEAMARAGTVAVMLPGAYYFLRDTRPPPIDLLRRLGVPMAVATDCNPGSSPMTSILLAMNMAATLFRMTVEECLYGVTVHAAKALGLAKSVGRLEPGLRCDLAIWDADVPAELVYGIGVNPLHARVWGGQ
jgi:imidazolonepropionase